MMLNDSKDAPFGGKRIGLVFTGGGGKGAYEIGVWRGLIAKGITRFAAISGTSIGGLNGYLVARGNLDDAERLWRELGHASPLKVSVLRFALGLLERIGIAIVSAITLYVLLPFVGVLGLVPTFLLWFLIARFDGLQPARALLPMLAMLILLLTERALRKTRIGRVAVHGAPYSRRDHRRWLLFSLEPWMHWLFALAGVAGLPFWMLWRDVVWQHRSLQCFWLLPVPFLFSLATIYLSIDPGISSISQIPLFAGDALERELAALLTKDERIDENGIPQLKIEPQLFATRLVERPISLPNLPDRAVPRYSPTATALGLDYVSLRDEEIHAVHKVLSATGAIAGFLPRVYGEDKLGGLAVSELPEIYYDAGSIDNTPVAPLLELDLCEVLIVLLLDYEIEDPPGYLRRYLDTVNDRVRQANPDISDDVWAALAGFRVLYPARVSSDNLNDVQLVPIVPSRPLGGFIRGTLRFKSNQIEEHMRFGFWDAQAAIDKALKGTDPSSGISTSPNIRGE